MRVMCAPSLGSAFLQSTALSKEVLHDLCAVICKDASSYLRESRHRHVAGKAGGVYERQLQPAVCTLDTSLHLTCM